MKNYRKYDEDFKQSLVNLYHSGKTQTACVRNMECLCLLYLDSVDARI